MADEKNVPKRVANPEPASSHKELIHPNGGSASGSDLPYAEHGAAIDHNISQENVIQARPDLWWSRVRHRMRDPFAEFLGVFILILFGDGVVAQVWNLTPIKS